MKKYEVIIGRTVFESITVEADSCDEACDLVWDLEGSGKPNCWDSQAEVVEVNEIE